MLASSGVVRRARQLSWFAWAALASLACVDAAAREGVRLGDAALAPLPVWAWLVAVLVAGLTGDGSRAWRAGAAALVLAGAGLIGLHEWRRSEPAGALQVTVARASAPQAPVASLSLSLAELGAAPRLAQRLGRRADIALRADGFVTLLDGGAQRVGLHCAGTCALSIDGRVVARADDAAGRVQADVPLLAGVHALRLELEQPGLRARLALDWDGPSRVEWLPLEASLSATPIAPAVLRATLRRSWLRAALAAALTLLVWLGLARLGRRAPAALRASLASARAWADEPLHRRALLVGAVALLFLGALHALVAPHALPNGRLHAWSSEYMMQTVSAADLRVEPLRSLVYLHIQPPLFDALRGLLVALHPTLDGAALLLAVDRGLYLLWALAYAAGAALVFVWIARDHGAASGALAAALFALHPATLFYATFLDTTFVSALGVSALIYELARASRGASSGGRLAAVLIALLLTRSIVQWPFLLVAGAALALIGAPPRVTRRALGAFALALILFVGKQYLLFGLTITSSFGPDSFCKGLSQFCLGTTPVEQPRLPSPAAASVLRRTEKLDGEYNYNQLAFLKRSFAQMEEYRGLLRATPPARLAALVAFNASIWLRPSSRHSTHALVDRLPWRAPFDALMSGPRLVALLVAACAGWAWRARASSAALRRGLGLALPCLYVAAVSIVFESGENMRYKFFVEPVLLVFLCAQGSEAWAAWRRRARA